MGAKEVGSVTLGVVRLERKSMPSGREYYTWHLTSPDAKVTEAEVVFLEEMCLAASKQLLNEHLDRKSIANTKDAYEQYHQDHAPFTLASEPVKSNWIGDVPGLQNVPKDHENWNTRTGKAGDPVMGSSSKSNKGGWMPVDLDSLEIAKGPSEVLKWMDGFFKIAAKMGDLGKTAAQAQRNHPPGGIPGGIPHPTDPCEAPGCNATANQPPSNKEGTDDAPLPINPDCPETLEHCPGQMECQQKTVPGRPLYDVLNDEDPGEAVIDCDKLLNDQPNTGQQTWRDRPPML